MNEIAAVKQQDPTSVLIVEDEWMVAWDLERSLKEMGYQVVGTVDSSQEALRVAAERRPDVALMDIRINGEADGIATAAALAERFDVPVVYLTAYTDDATLARAALTQPYGYVVKPFTNREVKSAIEMARHKHAADARVAESQRWFATTLRSIGDGVVACDLSHRVRFMNPVAESLTGWKEEEARGRPVSEVVRIQSGAGLREPLREAILSRQPQTIPPGARLLSRQGGMPAEIDDSACPIERGGDVLGAVLVFRDVTEQRRLQRQVAAGNRLTSMGPLASGLVHELTDPLSYVLSNLGFLAAGLDRMDAMLHNGDSGPSLSSRVEELIEVVDEVRVGAERIHQVVADLQEFGRPGGDALEPTDVREVLLWAMRVTAPQVRHRGRLVTELEEVPQVMASEARLGPVFVHLLINAAEALPPGVPARSEIRVRCAAAPDGRVSVTVSDTGSGIAPEHMDRLFTPFFTTKEPGPGTGLGLSICRSLVTGLGGEIRVRTVLGQGSAFEVLLPPVHLEAGRAGE